MSVASRRGVAVDLNLGYTFRLVCQNGSAVYLRCLIFLRGFYNKGSFAVGSGSVGVVVEYTFRDGISFGSGDGGRPTVSPTIPKKRSMLSYLLMNN